MMSETRKSETKMLMLPVSCGTFSRSTDDAFLLCPRVEERTRDTVWLSFVRTLVLCRALPSGLSRTSLWSSGFTGGTRGAGGAVSVTMRLHSSALATLQLLVTWEGCAAFIVFWKAGFLPPWYLSHLTVPIPIEEYILTPSRPGHFMPCRALFLEQ